MVGKARSKPSTQSAITRSRRRPANPIRDSGPRPHQSPNVRVQSLPSSRHELKAWHRGRPCTVYCSTAPRTPGPAGRLPGRKKRGPRRSATGCHRRFPAGLRYRRARPARRVGDEARATQPNPTRTRAAARRCRAGGMGLPCVLGATFTCLCASHPGRPRRRRGGAPVHRGGGRWAAGVVATVQVRHLPGCR